MLTSVDMLEHRTGQIELKDMSKQSGLQLLSYLYNGWVKPNFNMVDLLEVCKAVMKTLFFSIKKG
jgi:hypothetical protein